MSTPTCPKCKRIIPSEEVSVANNVAFCRACNLAHQLSALVHGSGLTEKVDLHRPPAGAWFRNDASGTVVGATHRSLGTALGLLGISLFWNGIVSVFVALAIVATLKHLHLPVPDWFPTPKMNGEPMNVGITIFLWLFLTPFIVIGAGMIGGFLSCLVGRTDVHMKGSQGMVFTGIGPLGWRRRFDPATVKDVRIDDGAWTDSDGHRQNRPAVVIEAQSGKLVEFGTMLTEDRRKFVAAALRLALVR